MKRFTICFGIAALLFLAVQTPYLQQILSDPIIIKTGVHLTALQVGDLNGDGLPDAAVSAQRQYRDTASIRIYIQSNPDGLQLARTVKCGGCRSNITGFTRGDFNHDGMMDLGFLCGKVAGIVYQAIGGGIDTVIYKEWPYRTSQVIGGDFNSDGRDDVALSFKDTTLLKILYQNPDGSFQAQNIHEAFSNALDLSAEDINGDNKTDLIILPVQETDTSVVVVHYQGSVGLSSNYATVGIPMGNHVFFTSMATGDVNGDGRNDLAVTSGYVADSAKVLIWTQKPNGSLSEVPFPLSVYYNPQAICIEDFNEDGFDDVVILHAGRNRMTAFAGTNQPQNIQSFSFDIPYTSNFGPESMKIADVTGDGMKDVLIASYKNKFILLVNQSNPQSLEIGEDLFTELFIDPQSKEEKDLGMTSLSAYPNPGNFRTTVAIETTKNISTELSLIDWTGRQVYTSVVNLTPTYNEIHIDLSDYPSGTYLVSARSRDGKQLNHVFILMK